MLFSKEEEGITFHAHRLNDCNQFLQMLCSFQERLTLVLNAKPPSLLVTHTEPVAVRLF